MNNVRISFPFLASHALQMPAPGRYDNQAVEATIFNRSDLETATWRTVWTNIEAACRAYGAENVSFHFPVNDCDFVADRFVSQRLSEAVYRACSLGIAGVVVHSNRIRPIGEWTSIDMESERSAVISHLLKLTPSSNEKTWLALENMPIMDNHGKEIDPLFVFPNDFKDLHGSNLGIVWDVCHYASTLANVAQVAAGHQSKSHYPNLQQSDLLDFRHLAPSIKHWHFSAFKGIANPDTGESCLEGVLPDASNMDEDDYVHAWKTLCSISDGQIVVLEIIERNYINRTNILKMSSWCRNH